MWKVSKTIALQGATINELWDAHADVANWAKWHPDMEFTIIDGPAQVGTIFYIKPGSGPKTKLKVTRYEKPYVWTDVAFLPLAKMHTTTYMKEVEGGVEVRLEIKMKGIMTFLWKKIIGQRQLNVRSTNARHSTDKGDNQWIVLLPIAPYIRHHGFILRQVLIQ